MIDDEIYDIAYDAKLECDTCKHLDKHQDDKPCNTCMQWVEGYLKAVNYKQKLKGGK